MPRAEVWGLEDTHGPSRVLPEDSMRACVGDSLLGDKKDKGRLSFAAVLQPHRGYCKADFDNMTYDHCRWSVDNTAGTPGI